MTKIGEPENYREWKLDEILSSDKFSDTVNKLKELGNDWQLTPNVVESYSEFNAAIEEIGVTSKDVADKLNGIAIPPEFIEFDGGKLIQNVRSIQSEYNNSKISITDANEQIEKSAIKAFSNSTDAIETFLSIFKLVPPVVSSLADRPTQALNEFSENASKLQDVLDKLAKGEFLDISEIDKLIEEFPQLRDALIVDASGIPSLNDRIIREVIQEMKSSFDRNISNEMASVQAEIDKLKISLTVNDNSETEVENLKKKIDGLTDKLIALSKVQYIDLSKVLQADSLPGINAQLDTLQSSYKTASEAIEEYNKNGSVSIDTLQALLALSPEYLSALDFEAGKVKINEERARALTEALKAETITKFKNAAVSDILAIANGNIEAASVFARTAIENMGSSLETAGIQADAASDSFRKIWVAIATMRMAAGEQNVGDDIRRQLDTVVSAYENLIKDVDNLSVDFSNIYQADSSNSSKQVEIYIADINRLYEAEERLKSIQEQRERTSRQLDLSGNTEQQIAYMESIIELYKQEQDALHEVAKQRRAIIKEQVAELESVGFNIDYDAESNKLFVHNMEHVNKIVGSTVEETNELRKKYEGLKIFRSSNVNPEAQGCAA